MALTDTTFILLPNQYDGRQRLSDPLGEWQPGVVGLQPVTGLTISNTTHNSQQVSWQHDEGDGIEGYQVDIWVAAQDLTWRVIAGPLVGTKTITSSGLPAERSIRYRVAAYIDGTPVQYSSWAEVDGVTSTSPVSGGETNLLELTFFYNFQGLSDGQKLRNSYMAGSPFSACENFTVDGNKQGAGGPGTNCAHTFLQGNNSTTGWADWGYALTNLANKPIHGAEVWWRQAVFWPTNAYFGSSGAGLKQMRMERNTISGSNRGATELLLASNKEQLLSVEYVDPTHDDGYGGLTTGYMMGPPALTFGKWTFIEMYCKFHEDKNIGEVASWIDGVPAGRVFGPTMGDTQEWNWGMYFATYWNGYESRSDYNEQWYDQIAIAHQGPMYNAADATDEQYLAIDINGYNHIGTAINTDDLT
jgi:hypothetical protein